MRCRLAGNVQRSRWRGGDCDVRLGEISATGDQCASARSYRLADETLDLLVRQRGVLMDLVAACIGGDRGRERVRGVDVRFDDECLQEHRKQRGEREQAAHGFAPAAVIKRASARPLHSAADVIMYRRLWPATSP